jgi:hypothetical protein
MFSPVPACEGLVDGLHDAAVEDQEVGLGLDIRDLERC